MFKNLRTSTKLALLCAMFIIAIIVTTYSLVTEKQIAIAFAQKELVGSAYLATVRRIFAEVLAASPIEGATNSVDPRRNDLVEALVAAQARAGDRLQTGEIAEALAKTLGTWSRNRNTADRYGLSREALAKAKQLAARIADDSNLALDPDIDSYHVQDIVTRKLPVFLLQLNELQILSHEQATAQTSSKDPTDRIQILGGLLRSTAVEITENLAAAYRGNRNGSLQRAMDGPFATMMSTASAYLGGLSASSADVNSGGRNSPEPSRLYSDVSDSSLAAWAVAQGELDRLLQTRISGLTQKLLLSLLLTGTLAGLSILVAVMTHRHIVQPLERLESVASRVRETKDYSLRVDHISGDEIGRLAAAFNEMLSELAVARERERADQSEFMHSSRLTTMGAMTASIAHEINQPLAAIVNNSSAARRWLSSTPPNVEEAREALKSIVSDGHRASQVIASVRSMFKKDGPQKVELAVNDVIEDVLSLVGGDIRKQGVVVRTELLEGLPDVFGDRIQLLQVFMNLVRNAVEAMASQAKHERLLIIRSNLSNPETVTITMEDTGMGIDTKETERIFDAFYTTKPDGMGMGLSICRSIVEAHGGRLWASHGQPRGSVFHVALPSSGA